jgi:hypothetical protein
MAPLRRVGKLSEFAKTLTKGAHIQVGGELRSREHDSLPVELAPIQPQTPLF